MNLQDRIEELESGILEFTDKKVHVTGFLSTERLIDYYEKNINCFFSKGLYDIEDLKFQYIKDNALFIVIKNNSITKYQFNVIKKDSFQLKTVDENNKTKITTKTYKLRKNKFDNSYNYIDNDTNEIFFNVESLNNFISLKYNTKIIL